MGQFGDRPPHAEHDTVLFIGHPGHELRLFHWLECTRPFVAVVTDGSGGASANRVTSTLRLLERAGASPLDSCMGFCSDRRAYEALLARDAGFFTDMVCSIEAALSGRSIACVASDAIEHFNPTHDLCCLLASKLALRRGGGDRQPVRHLVFPLDAAPTSGQARAVVDLTLDDEALARKLDAARGYLELHQEVEAALRAFGAEAFRRECLWHAGDPFDALEARTIRPHYERVGLERQAQGRYADVITLEKHVRPVARAVRAWNGTGRLVQMLTRPRALPSIP